MPASPAKTMPKPSSDRRRDLKLVGGDVVKKQLTVAQAADQWIAAKEAIAQAEALKGEAAEVLIEYFEKTERTTYKDRIAYTTPPMRNVLDQTAVKKFLGKRLPDFMKPVYPKKSLSLLK